MPLSSAQTKWLDAFGGVAAATDAYEHDQTVREGVLENLDETLNEWKSEIAAGQQYEITVADDAAAGKLKRFFGRKADKTMSSVDAGGDAMEEVDAWADLPGAQGMEASDVQRIMVAQARIVSLQEKMLAATDADGNRLFTDQQITDELWQPLVREGIIPENAVPDRFSTVKQTFDGANAFYEERLADFTAEQTDTTKLLAKLGKAQKFVDLGVSVADNVAGAALIGQSDAANETHELVSTLVGVTLSGGFAVAESTIKRDVEGVIDGVVDTAAGIIGAAVGEPVGPVIERALNSAVSSGKLAKSIAEGDVDGALDALGTYCENAFALADGTGEPGLGAAVAEWTSFAVNRVKNGKQIHDAMTGPDAPDLVAINEALTDMFGEIAEKIRTARSENAAPENETDEQKEAREKQLEEDNEFLSSILEEENAIVEGMFGLADAGDSDEVQAMKKRLAAMELRQAQADIEQSQLEFQDLLANGFALPNTDEEAAAQDARRTADSIDALILQMQKDKVIIATVEGLVSAGVGIATQIVPALGAAKAAIEFAKRAVAAAMRARELNEWLANLEDASAASSVYAESIRNRVHNAKVQLSQDVIQAILDLAKLVGATASCTGLAAPVGQAIEKGAAAASAAAELLYEIHKEAELAAAWKVYQTALRTPGNRKAIRESMRSNPTLAKYAMAYGALVAQDAIAMEVMNRCGLNEKTLRTAGANCHKVVQYLELKFADDPVLERCIPNPEAWHPESVALTLRSFMLFEAAADPPAEDGRGAAVKGMLSQYVTADAAVATPADDADAAALAAAFAACETMLAVAEQLQAALQSYRPRTLDGVPHDGLRDYADTLSALVTNRSRDVRVLRQDIVRQQDAIAA